MTMGLL